MDYFLVLPWVFLLTLSIILTINKARKNKKALGNSNPQKPEMAIPSMPRKEIKQNEPVPCTSNEIMRKQNQTNTLNEDGSIHLDDGIQIFYKNTYGDKLWHTLQFPKVGKNWCGDVCIYAEGRNKDTITYNLKRILKIKIDGELIDVDEYFEPINKTFQKIIDEYKIKADNIVKNIDGFNNAIIFHCAIHNTVALSKELKGIAFFSMDCNFAKTIDEIKRMSFNASKSIITFYLDNKETPKAYINITNDFGEPKELYDKIKDTIETIRSAK